MNGAEYTVLAVRGWAATALRLCFFLGCALGVAGCDDHRISLAEFLEMQENACDQATAPAPAEMEDVAHTLIERRLGPYKIGESDVLTVTLTGADDATLFPLVQVRVDREGEVDLPIIGAVNVADMELQDVEDTIHGAYVPHVVKDASVHVELIRPDYTNVLVVGAVTIPGLVQLTRTQRDMLHAIVTAGGVTDFASGEATLRRLRDPNGKVTLTLTEPAGLRDALALEPLEDGDIVTVHAAVPNTIFVGGLVNGPLPQTYPPGVEMTVLQAIAASGGLRTDVTPREATLIRRLPDDNDVHVKLNLDRITTGKDANIVLAAGDILWVPHTIETRIQDWINRNLFVRAGISATAGANYNATALEYMNSKAERASNNFFQTTPSIQDTFDPFGSLLRNTAIQNLATQPPPPQ